MAVLRRVATPHVPALQAHAQVHTRVPKFQAFFRERRPPLLAVWGKNDPFFLPAGAKAFARDNPDAEIHFFETGHFALETHANEIAGKILGFLKRVFG